MTITDQTARTPAGATARVRRPLPDGAVKWSRFYIDNRGVHESPHDVPVDANDRRTEHIRVSCTKVADCRRDAWILPGDPVVFCRDHGAALSAEKPHKDPMLPWSAMWHAVEKPLRPAWVLAAEAAAGLGLYEGEFTPLAVIAAGGCATAAAYAATRIYLTRRAVRRHNIERGQKTGRHVETIGRRARTAGYAGVISTGWLAVASSVDPGTALGRAVWAALPIGWAVGAAPWWRYLEADRNRRVPLTAPAVADAEDDEAEAEIVNVDAASAAQAWIEHAGLANTRLDVATWTKTPAGWSAVVVVTKLLALVSLNDGDQVKKIVSRIAATYGVKRAAVTLIPEYDDDPNRALLLVQPRNPLKAGQIWGGPDTIDMVKGVAEIGRLITGEPMYETLYRYGWGAPSALTLGTTGGGKSERNRKKIVIERWATYIDAKTGERKGAFITFLHDPKRMQSYPEFKRAVHAYGMTNDDAHILIDALIREMFRRYDMMREVDWIDQRGRERDGISTWNPTIHGPIISTYWDEFHDLAADKEFIKKIERYSRFKRAAGMRDEVGTHGATIGDTGSQALRDLVAGGRANLFRTTNALNASLSTGGQLVGDPRTLPKDPGMLFVADGETATVMGRESWIPGEESGAEHTLYDWLFDDSNQPIGFPAAIPPETAEAFGREFMEWAEAGRQRGGRAGIASAAAAFMPPVADRSAEDALRQVLFDAGRPLSRGEIAASSGWGSRNITSTLTKALRAGQDARPPWLVKAEKGNGIYELAAAARQEMTAAVDEEREDRAA